MLAGYRYVAIRRIINYLRQRGRLLALFILRLLDDRYHARERCDVLLFYPRANEDFLLLPPFPLLAVAAPLIEDGLRVVIIDQRIEPDCLERISGILSHGVICLGTTFYTGNQIRHACDILDELKSRYPELKIVVGGPHASVLPRQTAEYPAIDYVVVGEGEETFRELVHLLRANRDPAEVRGLAFRRGQEVVETPPRPPVDLNNCSRIPYELIEHYRFFYPVGAVFTSRGCPSSCAYCMIHRLYPDWRSIRAELVVEQVENLLRFGIGEVAFIDDNFFASTKHVEEILALLEERGLQPTWWAECRIDDLLRMAPALLARLRSAGLTRIYLGAESGSERILRLIDKRITPDMTIQANRRLRAADIAPEYTFMAGFPTETSAEVEQTLALIRTLRKENPAAAIWRVNVYVPYPGTRLYDLALREGFHPPKELRGWADLHWYRRNFSTDYERELY